VSERALTGRCRVDACSNYRQPGRLVCEYHDKHFTPHTLVSTFCWYRHCTNSKAAVFCEEHWEEGTKLLKEEMASGTLS
jgi:hypothetical protein